MSTQTEVLEVGLGTDEIVAWLATLSDRASERGHDHDHRIPIALGPPDQPAVAGEVPGWHRLDGFLAPGATARRVDYIAQVIGPECPRGLPAAWDAERFSWFLAVTAFASALGRGVVPELEPERTWIKVAPHGMIERIALEPEAAWASADQLGNRLVRTIAPLLAILSQHGRPERTLWRHAGDSVAAGAVFGEVAVGMPGSAIGPLEAIQVAEPRLAVPLRFGELEPGEPWRPRYTCCLARQVPGCPTCHDCPLHAHDQAQGTAAG